MKKRVLELSMAVLLLLGVFVLSRQGAAYVETMETQTEQKIVVIDAGHGGSQLRKCG